jgi:hypothetical protein
MEVELDAAIFLSLWNLDLGGKTCSSESQDASFGRVQNNARFFPKSPQTPEKIEYAAGAIRA